MDDKIKLLLLKLLKEDGDISNIEKAGYQYSSIANTYSKLINEKFIIPNENLEFVLTEKGFSELQNLQDKIVSKGKWEIEPFIKFKVDKIDKYDIFIE